MTQRKTPPLVAFVLGIALSTVCCARIRAEESRRQQIDQLVQPYLDNDIVVGMTVGLLDGRDESIFGYGHMARQSSRTPDGDTIYEIGSISKVFTGLLLADAAVRQLVALDQPAGELLPAEVKMPSRGDQAITLGHLATHASGLPGLPSNLKMTDPENPYAAYTVKDLYAFLTAHKLARAPGTKQEYSNLGGGLLGHLLARGQKTGYEQLLRERIAKPLEMTSTAITLDKQQQSRLAQPHTVDTEPTKNWDLPALAGAGAIRSTTRDMLRFARAQLEPPAGELGEAIELAWKVYQEPLAKGGLAMGLGWHVAGDGSTRWHNGQTGGYHAALFVSRKQNISVVLLANTATMEVDRLAADIMRLLTGANVKPRKFEKPVEVAAEIMQRYAGRYELAPGVAFTVAVKDGKLMVALSDQPAYQVYPRSETVWFYKVVKATLTFKVNDEGQCEALELFQNGVRQTARRVE